MPLKFCSKIRSLLGFLYRCGANDSSYADAEYVWKCEKQTRKCASRKEVGMSCYCLLHEAYTRMSIFAQILLYANNLSLLFVPRIEAFFLLSCSWSEPSSYLESKDFFQLSKSSWIFSHVGVSTVLLLHHCRIQWQRKLSCWKIHIDSLVSVSMKTKTKIRQKMIKKNLWEHMRSINHIQWNTSANE